MSKHLSPNPKMQWFDEDGLPLIDGKLYTYAAGTTTPLATYTDKDGGTENTNPIILDAYGSADVWLSDVPYKFVLKTSADVTIWTVDWIKSSYIYADDITWTGDHIFEGSVTLDGGELGGDITFTGSTTVDNNLYVTGNLSVDGTLSFDGSLTVDSVTTPLITLGAAGTIEDTAGVMDLTSANNLTVTVNTSAFTFDFMEIGTLRLPNVDPIHTDDAANKGYVDAQVAAAVVDGTVAVAIGAVVSNALVSGSIGITSVNHSGTGTYVVTLSSATTSTGKTIAMVSVRNAGYSSTRIAYATVDSTTQITVKTGGGNSFDFSDVDFNIVVYSLP